MDHCIYSRSIASALRQPLSSPPSPSISLCSTSSHALGSSTTPTVTIDHHTITTLTITVEKAIFLGNGIVIMEVVEHTGKLEEGYDVAFEHEWEENDSLAMLGRRQ